MQFRLATITREEFWALPDAYEGVENLIFKKNAGTVSREQLIMKAATRRYSMARLSRLLCHALLHTNITLWSLPPVHLHLVGFRKTAAAFAKKYDKKRIGEVERKRINEISEQLQYDRRADAVWYNTTDGEGGLSQMRKTLIL